MRFQDRLDAGRQLAQALAPYRGQHPLVLAIPRGAVPMARVVAEALDGELDVVLVRKIGAPDWAEFAVAAVDESGWVYRNPQVPDSPALRAHIAAQREVELERIRQRRAQYTPGRGPVAVQGRTVIVVDDGLATGATMIAALHGLRQQGPAQLARGPSRGACAGAAAGGCGGLPAPGAGAACRGAVLRRLQPGGRRRGDGRPAGLHRPAGRQSLLKRELLPLVFIGLEADLTSKPPLTTAWIGAGPHRRGGPGFGSLGRAGAPGWRRGCGR